MCKMIGRHRHHPLGRDPQLLMLARTAASYCELQHLLRDFMFLPKGYHHRPPFLRVCISHGVQAPSAEEDAPQLFGKM